MTKIKSQLNSHKKAKGFTLIELLVVSTISVFLVSAVYFLQQIVADTQNATWDNTIRIESGNRILDPVTTEIRTMRASEDGRYPLELADSHELIFFSDYDFDQTVERVRYFLDGTTLKKGVVEPVGVPVVYDLGTERVTTISDFVANDTTPIFFYYNGDWPSDTVNNPLTFPGDVSEVKMVRVNILISEDSLENIYEVNSFVSIRMLKENL